MAQQARFLPQMPALPLLTPLFAVRFSRIPHSDHGESMPEPLNLKELVWDRLLYQIRNHPDPKVRADAAKEACQRVWDGPNQPEERIPARMFWPEE